MHDGEPFTSEDVKFTMEEVIVKIHPRAGVYDAVIESIETPDDDTIIFNLKTIWGIYECTWL